MTTPAPKTTTALDTLLSHPVLSALVPTLPPVAEAAAAARRELAAATTAAAAAREEARRALSAGTGAAMPTGAAPIIRAEWTPTAIPTDPAYILPPGMAACLRSLLRAQMPAMMIGPAGTGKTEAAAIAASAEGRPLYTVDCGPVRDASEWFGAATLSAGRVAWQDSTLCAALQTPGCVILLDEVNRAHSEAQNALLPLLDSRRAIQFPSRAEPVALAEGVTFILTANIGAEYTGTGAIDRALRDRCRLVETEYLPADMEARNLTARFPAAVTNERAEALAELAAATREASWASSGEAAISTRALIATVRHAAALIDVGETPGDAYALAVRCLLSGYSNEGTNSPRAQLAALAVRFKLTA